MWGVPHKLAAYVGLHFRFSPVRPALSFAGSAGRRRKKSQQEASGSNERLSQSLSTNTQVPAGQMMASKGHTVLTWLRLRGCTPFVTTRCGRYPVGVIQHPDDCPLTEATGLVLLVLLRMPERFCHFNPFFLLMLHACTMPTMQNTAPTFATELFLQLQLKIRLYKKRPF